VSVIYIPEKNPCQETIHKLRDRWMEASRGRCIGIVYAAMYEGREYIVDIAGAPRMYPTFTLGMVRRLDHELNSLFTLKYLR
jgi:hypothetical protein